ncbi:MAG: peptidoglycan-binding protein, partial [Actinomycetota bacterium]|nr:peptidoglycan-binding protein [Actinomycetota bacterium]
ASATTAPPATTSAVPTTQLGAPLALGSSGDEVVALQRQLRRLGFDPGPGDGEFGRSTEQAVWAAEALILGRTPVEKTGTVDVALWQRLHEEVTIQPRRTMPGTHVEIYLDLQVAVVFTDDVAVLVTHISSGQLNPDGMPVTFCEEITIDTDELGNPMPEPEVRGVCSESKTPGGVFEVHRRYEGERIGPLGSMSNPIYFNYGIAIHGAQNVPVLPASHGGVRVPMHVAEYLPTLIELGDTVLVWDSHKEPEEQTKEDMLPSFLSPDTTE